MKRNLGAAVDRAIRVVLGIGLGYAAFRLPGAWAWVAGVLAVIGIVTGLAGFCALYAVFGINTNRPSGARVPQ
jgi:uncharacterized membrane protein YgaE (UPF0421/DUF939 family)